MPSRASRASGAGAGPGGAAAAQRTPSVAPAAAPRTTPLTPEATHIEPTSNQAYTVTSVATDNTFTYADPATGTNVTATVKSTDVFMVDGVTATIGAFTAALSPGDLVTILANTPTAGVTTYQLVNKVAADYTSGLVGTWAPGASISIVDPVTGVVLNTFTITGGFTVFTVDGTAVSRAVMEAGLNPGDTVSYTGTGEDASHIRTVAVTSKVLTGTVSAATGTTFKVDTAAGATLPTGWAILPVNGDTLTVDGADVVQAADFMAVVTNGDTVTYSRSAGHQVIALTNKAPLSIHGQITAVALTGSEISGFTYVPAGEGSTSVTGLLAGLALTVDGVLATDAEFNTAFTLGDTVVYRATDTETSTTASLALTNANFSGTVNKSGAATVVATTDSARIGVLAAGSSTVPLGSVDYFNNDGTKLAGTPVYKVNGVVKDIAGFNTALTAIGVGTLTGTILVSQVGATVVYALTTAIA